LYRFIFEEKDFGQLSTSQNQSYYKLFEVFLCGLCEKGELEIIPLVCESMVKLRLTSVDEIQNALRNVSDVRPQSWWPAFLGFLTHLRDCSKQEELIELVRINEGRLLSMQPDSLIQVADVLRAISSPYSDTFYVRAVGSLIQSAETNPEEKVLVKVQNIIRTLEEKGVKNLQLYKTKLISIGTRLLRRFKPLSGERVAIMGGNPGFEDKYKRIIGEEFGATCEWYSAKNTGMLRNLASSVKSGGINIVIYITGWGPHAPKDIVVPEIEKVNKEAGCEKIKLLMLERSQVNPNQVAEALRKALTENNW
jgi:hypothetical protein